MHPIRKETAIATLAAPSIDRRADRPASRLRFLISNEPKPVVRWAIAALLLWLLVGPRIELGHSIRVEDGVFAVLAVLCLLHLRGLFRPAGPSIAIAAVAAAGLISALVAAGRGMVDPVTAVLYAVRPLEYWIAFPAALLLMRAPDGRWHRRVDALLVIVTMLQTAFAVMQYYFGLPIGFSHAAYTRAAGLTVGPYELGAISAALVVYWVSRGRFAMASLSVIALAASISRISILGAVVGLVVLVGGWSLLLVRRARAGGWRNAFLPYRRSRLVIAGHALSVIGAGLVLAFTIGLIHLPAVMLPTTPVAEQPTQLPKSNAPSTGPTADVPAAQNAPSGPQAPSDSIAQRLASTSVLGSWNAASGIAARVPRPRTAAEYEFAAYAGMNIYLNVNTAADAGVEASNLVRFFRWHLILDTFNGPTDVVFGLGPSFVGPSVDGSYLRFFAEGGLLGVLAWLVLIVMWLRRSPFWMVCVTISLLVGALFIDIVYSERPMVLFWLLLAVAATAPRSAPATSSLRSNPDTAASTTQA